MLEDLVSEYLSKYVAPDGGGRLDLEDKGAPFEGCTLDRTNNENPILFLTQMGVEVIERDKSYKPTFKDLFDRHMGSTELVAGLHSRRCGDRFLIRQSHDNVVAMMIGSYFFGSSYGEKVFQYGISNDWCFNVANPGEYDVRCALQGGDVAIAYMATNRPPMFLDTIWLAGGLATTKAFNLADLRIKLISDVLPKLHWIKQCILLVGLSVYFYRLGSRTNWLGYYRKEHPFRRLASANI